MDDGEYDVKFNSDGTEVGCIESSLDGETCGVGDSATVGRGIGASETNSTGCKLASAGLPEGIFDPTALGNTVGVLKS